MYSSSVHDDGEEVRVQLRNSKKSPSALGLYVDHADGNTLLIQRITTGGLFDAWNAASPGQRVNKGDKIVSVNGIVDNAVAMMNALSRQEFVDVVVRLSSRAPLPQPSAPSAMPLRSVPAAEGGSSVAGVPATASTAAPAKQASELDSNVYEQMGMEVGPDGGWMFIDPLEAERARALKSIGTRERAKEPTWFRVVHAPYIPCRYKPEREAPLYTVLHYEEDVEVAEVRNGWARLAPQELDRRGLPSKDYAWAKIGGAFGFGKLLVPVTSPGCKADGQGPDEEDSAGPWWAEAEEQADVSGWEFLAEVERVVAESDKAWEILQGKRERFRAMMGVSVTASANVAG